MLGTIKIKIHNLLRKSERIFKTDMVYLAKGGFWVNLPQVASAMTGLLVALAFANFSSKETFGLYKYIISLAGIVSAFSLTGMNTAIVRAVAQGKDNVFVDSIPVQMRWSALTIIVSLLLSIYYIFQNNYILAIGVLIISIFQPISNVTNSYTAYLNGKKNFKTLSKYTIISNILSAVAIITAVIVKSHIIVIVSAYFVSVAIGNTLFYIITRRKIIKKNSEDGSEAVTYGKKLSLLSGLSYISGQIDSVLIFHYLGVRELSIYAFAILVPERFKSLFRFTSVIALPKFSQKTRLESQQILKSKIIKLLLISLAAMLLYIMAAPLLYKFLFSQYTDSIIFSQVFAMTFLTIPGYILSPALLSMGVSKELYWSSTVTPIVQIVTTFFLVYFFGLWGAISAKIISSFFHLGFSSYLIMKKTQWL